MTAIGILSLLSAFAVSEEGKSAERNAASAKQQEAVRVFDIPSQSLDAALILFGEQAGVTVSVATTVVAGKVAPAVHGQFSEEEVLARLLTGTGLEFATPRPGIFVVRERNTLVVRRDAAVEEREIQEVAVTGTHIRNVALVGTPMRSIGRREIESAGYSTMEQLVRDLPQTFGGGPNELTINVPGVDRASALNVGRGSGVNLRGLGVDETLVLVNGRRVAAGGYGNFIDVSMIPIAAIERIDVLLDGASAVYGADAVAGVVNIMLRRDLEGFEMQVESGSVTHGERQTFGFSQLAGATWGDEGRAGEVFAGYAFWEQDALASEDRSFAADSDLRAFGGPNRGSPFSNPGNISDGGTTYAIPAGQDGRSLSPGDLRAGERNLLNLREGTDLLPRQKMHSAFFTTRQEIAGVDLRADARLGQRAFRSVSRGDFMSVIVPDTNPFYVSPFAGEDVTVQYSFVRDLGQVVELGDVTSQAAAVGVSHDFSDGWRADAALSGSRDLTEFGGRNLVNSVRLAEALDDEEARTAFNVFGDGSNTDPVTIERVRGFFDQRNEFELWAVDATLDGPLGDVRGEPLRLAVGGHFRAERFQRSQTSYTSTPEPVTEVAPTGRREVTAGFAELIVPVALDAQLSLAGRMESYSDVGHAFTPKVGLEWSPVDVLTVRATYGESFRAPSFLDLDESTRSAALVSVADANSPGGETLALVVSGDNADLREERATTWTVGGTFAPSGVPGLRASATWFDISLRDRISRPGNAQTVLLRESDFASIITRAPSDEAVLALFAEPFFSGVPVDPALVGAIIDVRTQNLAWTRVRGLDLEAEQRIPTATGSLSFRLHAHLVKAFEQAATERAALVELGGTVGGPLELRARGDILWEGRSWTVAGFINYRDDYRDTLSSPNRRVASWTSLDIRAGWKTGMHALALGVTNVFDREPPVVAHVRGVAFDPANAEVVGRSVNAEWVMRW